MLSMMKLELSIPQEPVIVESSKRILCVTMYLL